MWDFILKGAVGLVLLLILAYLMVFVDWLSTKLKRGLPETWFVAGVWLSIAVVSWLLCYGAGSLFFVLLFGQVGWIFNFIIVFGF